MERFTIYKKRDGGSFKESSEVYASSYEEAKKEFARKFYNKLNEGSLGSDYIEETEDSIKGLKAENVDTSWFEGKGIYFERELFMPYSDVENGIESFSEDVYTWTIDRDRI